MHKNPYSDSFPLAWDRLMLSLQNFTSMRFTPTRVRQTECFANYCIIRSIHSHSRGMNFEKIVPNVTLPDAFPHTRDSRGVYPVDRFTPTSVGQTKRYESQASSVSIHSHSRGIKWRPPCFPGTRHESFPRMWNKLPKPFHGTDTMRLIPTHVGQTF